MKLGAISLFERCHGNGTPIKAWNLVGLHWPSSITWRWTLWWEPYFSLPRLYYYRTHRGLPGLNGHVLLCIPVLGRWSLQAQPNMWKVKK